MHVWYSSVACTPPPPPPPKLAQGTVIPGSLAGTLAQGVLELCPWVHKEHVVYKGLTGPSEQGVSWGLLYDPKVPKMMT